MAKTGKTSAVPMKPTDSAEQSPSSSTSYAPEAAPLVALLAVVHAAEAALVVVHALERVEGCPSTEVRVRSRPAGAYKPFGTGKRICTGRNFARVEAALALATLAREFDFADPGPLRIMSAPLPKPRGFRLRVSPRAKRHASGA